ncbi:MFS transporter [Actinocatenispora comari]|uniref:MFS transporter n=1 Tax=Actinocatenispora comari TaxID=2807577 RepID=A0A8J4AEA4_9ACTN|nr:MFS transporter [Actinocatenispora comari]GIL27542.1 MFS transporter [Actinocatenispora comari]
MLWRNRNFVRLWTGQAVSIVGDFVFDTTLTLWIGVVLLRGRTFAPAAVSGLLIVVAVVTMVVAPIAGVFVDRWDRRRTMLVTDLVRAALVGGLTAVAFLPAGTLSNVTLVVLAYAVVACSTAAGQFFNPARFAMIGAVVPAGPDRSRAGGIGQATNSIAAIVGPPLAAPLLFAVGVRWSLLINAASFLFSFLAVRAVRVEPAPDPAGGARGGFRAEFLAGVRYVAANRVLRTVLIAVCVVTVGTGALNALNVFFVTDNLHAAAHWYGTIGMAEGIGSVLGALGAAAIAARLGNARVFAVGLVVVGLGTIVYARMPALLAGLVVIVVLAVPLGALNSVLSPLVLDATPPRLVGRVISVLNPTQQVASLAGVAVAGWLASIVLLGFDADVAGVHLGRLDTILLAAGLLVLIGGVYAMVALRGVDRAAQPPAADADPSGPVVAAGTDPDGPHREPGADPEPPVTARGSGC